MSETDQWLVDYERSHRAIHNGPVYWLAVPLLVVGMVGLLWTLPVPRELTRISPLLNWGSVFLMAALVYYFIISIPLAIGMVPFMLGITVIETWLANRGSLLSVAACGSTVLAIAGLWAGHAHAAGLRGVCRDIQLMMIAPVWMLSVIYRRLGIPR